jgi:hypothetical protein
MEEIGMNSMFRVMTGAGPKSARRMALFLLLSLALSLALTVQSEADAAVVRPPQGFQSDTAYANSFGSNQVTNVVATTQKTSCYTPQVAFFTDDVVDSRYQDGSMSPCAGAANTGEDLGPYATQNNPASTPMRVKDHSESDIQVDPTNSKHLIGSSKWFINGQAYNHLLGFYESFDGGNTWPVQGHVPGYEGWTDNTDPVGAFDSYGNYYSLVLPYQFAYKPDGSHDFSLGHDPNPAVPSEAIAIAVRPHGATAANQWITTRNGQPDYVQIYPNGQGNEPDKQWITIDTNPASPHFNTIYTMWTVFHLLTSDVYVSTATALPDGTHTNWTEPLQLATINGNPWDTYLLPHVTPDGAVYTTITNQSSSSGKNSAFAQIYLISSKDGGQTWGGLSPVVSGIVVPPATYTNTTFREGILNSFAAGKVKINGFYPLYATWEDAREGVTNVYLSASYDGGTTWTAAIKVNDNATPSDQLQPNLHVANNGTVAVAWYDRRLACPTQGSKEANGAGISNDPGTDVSAGTPYGRANYCINTSVQFYTPELAPKGDNIRTSAHTFDPQLSAPHTSCPTCRTTFLGDYYGVASTDKYLFTTSASTFNYAGDNPYFHQQQVVARIPIP